MACLGVVCGSHGVSLKCLNIPCIAVKKEGRLSHDGTVTSTNAFSGTESNYRFPNWGFCLNQC